MNNILKIIFVFVTFILADRASFSQQNWTMIQSPVTKDLRNVFFADSLKGWIGGDSGVVLHTVNNGQNWFLQNTGLTGPVLSVFFINESTGYALSWEFDSNPPNYFGTRILKTTNSGSNWTNYLFRDTNLFLNTIYFTDFQNGYMAGSEGKIYYTSNSGSEWIRSTVDSALITAFPVEKIKFVNAMTGFAAGGAFDIAGMIWKTTNKGRSWRADVVGPEPLNDFYIFDSSNIIFVGGDFEFGASKLITSNGGNNWNYSEFGVFGVSKSISYRTPSEGWISLGIVDSFLVTTNSGADWNLRETPAGAQIYDLQFTNASNGWAVGKNGVILKFTETPVTVSGNYSGAAETAELYQNYPNPFNPVTWISYRLQKQSNVSLKVYDILGNEIATLVNEKKNAGSYKAEFNGSNLSSGIYYYKMETVGNIRDTKRMVLLK